MCPDVLTGEQTSQIGRSWRILRLMPRAEWNITAALPRYWVVFWWGIRCAWKSQEDLTVQMQPYCRNTKSWPGDVALTPFFFFPAPFKASSPQLLFFQKHVPLVALFYFYFFLREWFHLIVLFFSLRCWQVWMNRDALLGCLIFLSLEKREKNEANREACRGY